MSTTTNTATAKKAGWITSRFILALVLFLVVLFVFVAITDEIVLEHENGFDEGITKYISVIVSASMTRAMEMITFFGSSNFLFPAYVVLILYYLARRKTQMGLDIGMIGLGSTGILYLLKEIFQRKRPIDPLIRDVTGFSFPSGHSFSSFTFFGLLIYILWNTSIKTSLKIPLTIILLLFAAIIAFSRVYLRVHYPSDVIAGFCLSVIWLMLSLWILHKTDRAIAFKKDRNKII
ncbi:MAG: phosphatase PAP2 family protein [Ginsengibacter sp.]